MNVLVVITKNAEISSELKDTVKIFSARDFRIHLLNDPHGDIQVTTLPTIIEYVKDVEEEVDRISVLSDIHPLLLAWYRCYNSVVDDFILQLDKEATIGLQQGLGIFIRMLSNLKGISQETIQGKIYVNFNMHNFVLISNFLLRDQRFCYFDDVKNFDFGKITKKKKIGKRYIFNREQFSFVPEEAKTVENIVCENTGDKPLEVNDTFMQQLEDNRYLIFYFVVTFYNLNSVPQGEKEKVLRTIFENASQYCIHKQRAIYLQFIRYLESHELPLKEKLFYMLLLTVLRVGKKRLLQKMLRALKEDTLYTKYHYQLLLSSVFCETRRGLVGYPEIMHDKEQILLRYIASQGEFTCTPKSRTKNNKRIAVIASQLLKIIHSPTLLVLQYVKHLKKYYPDYEIKIFVDDFYVFPDNELLYSYSWGSIPSTDNRASHEEFLMGTDIDIYYPDTRKERIERIQEDISAILSYNPGLLWVMGSDFSITRALLYPEFPVLNMSMGETSFSSKADIYISGYTVESMEKECVKYKLGTRNNYYHKGGVSFPDSQTPKHRKDFNIGEHSFVMVTVGTRLDAEMDERFIDIMGFFITNRPDAVWILVGAAKFNYLKSRYKNILKQIVFIDYEYDLAALYQLCDVYVNPFRKHGGFSAGMAMNQYLPVLALREESDVLLFVGEENACDSIEDYAQELDHLYDDSTYRKIRGNDMKQRLIKEFGFEQAIDDVVHFVELTLGAFAERKNK